MHHRRTTSASVFQNGISRNTKCDNLVGFPKSSHIQMFVPQIRHYWPSLTFYWRVVSLAASIGHLQTATGLIVTLDFALVT